MLRCRDIAAEGSDYIDKALPWHRRLRMGFHLFICIRCRRFMRHLNIVRRMSQQRGTDITKPDDVQRIVEHVCKHH